MAIRFAISISGKRATHNFRGYAMPAAIIEGDVGMASIGAASAPAGPRKLM